MLTTEEIGLLRSLVEWRREQGWTLERSDFTYVSPDRKTEFWPGWGKELGDRMFITYTDPEPEQARERVIPPCLSLREAVDLLVLFGLLPMERFSSAFLAGRESAYDRDEWMVRAKRCHISATVHITAEDAAAALAYWRGIGISDSYLEHRRVAGKTDWV